jgi:hypothetical protein
MNTDNCLRSSAHGGNVGISGEALDQWGVLALLVVQLQRVVQAEVATRRNGRLEGLSPSDVVFVHLLDQALSFVCQRSDGPLITIIENGSLRLDASMCLGIFAFWFK